MKMEMTKNQILRFLKKVIADDEIEIEVTIFADKAEWAFGAWINVSDNNKKITVDVNKYLTADMRCLLLHEAGHLKGEDPHNDSIVERELSAQMWAIKRAKELGWSKIEKALKHQISKHWALNGSGKYAWNSCYRRYILASRLAQKRGLIS